MVSKGMTLTTAKSTTSSGATITGCNFKDEDSTIEIDVCTLDRQGAEATAMSQAQGSLTAKKHLALYARAADEPDWKCKRNVEDFFILIYWQRRKADVPTPRTSQPAARPRRQVSARQTTTVLTTTTNQRPITQTTATSTCQPIIGCNVEDDDSTFTITTDCEGVPTSTVGVGRAAAKVTARAGSLKARAPASANEVADDFIIFPSNPQNVLAFVTYLRSTRVTQSDSNSGSW